MGPGMRFPLIGPLCRVHLLATDVTAQAARRSGAVQWRSVQTDAVTRKTPPGASRLRRWTLALAARAPCWLARMPARAQSHHGGGGMAAARPLRRTAAAGAAAAAPGAGWGAAADRRQAGAARRTCPRRHRPRLGPRPPVDGPWVTGRLPPGYAPPGYGPPRQPADLPAARRAGPVARPGGAAASCRRSTSATWSADYGRYHLRRPPFGYHWVQVGDEFLLVSSHHRPDLRRRAGLLARAADAVDARRGKLKVVRRMPRETDRMPLTESYTPASRDEPLARDHGRRLLRDAAARWPDRVGLVEADIAGALGRRWTFAELLREAERLAPALATRYAPGERIASGRRTCPNG